MHINTYEISLLSITAIIVSIKVLAFTYYLIGEGGKSHGKLIVFYK